MSDFSHLNNAGEAEMVDVSGKAATLREATAEVFVEMKAQTLAMIREGRHDKGDVFAVARIAGIQAAKKTPDLIPLCHPLMLNKVKISFELLEASSQVRIESWCSLQGKTGVEMEALTAASVAALALYDMCKAVDKHMVISGLRVLEKRGGKSGDWTADGH